METKRRCALVDCEFSQRSVNPSECRQSLGAMDGDTKVFHVTIKHRKNATASKEGSEFMKAIPLSKTHRLGLSLLTGVFVLAPGCAHIPSQEPSPLNQAARFWGVGWSDGYHECDPTRCQRPQGCNPCASPCGNEMYQVQYIAPVSPQANPIPANPYAIAPSEPAYPSVPLMAPMAPHHGMPPVAPTAPPPPATRSLMKDSDSEWSLPEYEPTSPSDRRRNPSSSIGPQESRSTERSIPFETLPPKMEEPMRLPEPRVVEPTVPEPSSNPTQRSQLPRTQVQLPESSLEEPQLPEPRRAIPIPSESPPTEPKPKPNIRPEDDDLLTYRPRQPINMVYYANPTGAATGQVYGAAPSWYQPYPSGMYAMPSNGFQGMPSWYGVPGMMPNVQGNLPIASPPPQYRPSGIYR